MFELQKTPLFRFFFVKGIRKAKEKKEYIFFVKGILRKAKEKNLDICSLLALVNASSFSSVYVKV